MILTEAAKRPLKRNLSEFICSFSGHIAQSLPQEYFQVHKCKKPSSSKNSVHLSQRNSNGDSSDALQSDSRRV